jgi:hypothetical protein
MAEGFTCKCAALHGEHIIIIVKLLAEQLLKTDKLPHWY